MQIGNRSVGKEDPVFIIAEVSANHHQDINQAVQIIKAARKAGADAIKLQTYTPDTLTIDCNNPLFKIDQGTLWDGKTFYELYNEAYTPWEWHAELQNVAHKEGLIFFSTPFDKTAVDFLEELDVPAYKVASFEITDIPLIEYIASKGKPVLISTGIAKITDIEEAVHACRKAGNNSIVLMKCTSAYPAPIEEANIRTIPHLAEMFQVLTGLSDHTMGIVVPIVAVAFGARIIEKHVTLDRSRGGPDAAFSLEPDEFSEMVKAVREAETALGIISYELSPKTQKSRDFSRSLFVVRNISAGERLTEENIRSIRPGFGMHPRFLSQVLGKTARFDLKKGTPLTWNLVE